MSKIKRGVDAITTRDVLAVLTPLWTDKHPTAMRVLQRMSAVCRWAIAEGHRSDDPTANVTSVLPDCNGAEKHHEAMPYRDVGAFLSRLRTGVVPQVARLALEFLILTVTRTSEVRLMTWDEVDVDGLTWTVPAIRMKMGREHRVPLSDRAMAVLDTARTLESHGSNWMFPGSRDVAMSPVALLRATRKVGEASATPHGMRSAFRDWCSEQTDAPHAVMVRVGIGAVVAGESLRAPHPHPVRGIVGAAVKPRGVHERLHKDHTPLYMKAPHRRTIWNRSRSAAPDTRTTVRLSQSWACAIRASAVRR